MSVLHRVALEIDPSLNNSSGVYTFTNGTSYNISGCRARVASSRIGYDWSLLKNNVNNRLFLHLSGVNDDFAAEVAIPEDVSPSIDDLIIALNNGLSASSFLPMQPDPGAFLYNTIKVDNFNYAGTVRFEKKPGSDIEIQLVAVPNITIRVLTDKDLSHANKGKSINKILGNYKLGETTGVSRTQFFYPTSHQHNDLSIEILNLKTEGSLGADGQSHFNSHVHVSENQGGIIITQNHADNGVYLSGSDTEKYINVFDVRLVDTYTNQIVNKKRNWSFILEFIK